MTLYGMDISAYQFQTPSMAGLDFVCIKATQNTTMDPSWPLHYEKAREAGVFVIAYHFGEEAPAYPQVQRFLQVASHADAWVLDRDPSYYSQSMHRWVHQPEKSTCREFIVRMEAAGFPCGLYFNCANYIDVGQVWNWQASPPELCPSIPWQIYQAHSGVPRGDISHLDSMADLLGVTRVRQFIVNYDEPHTIHVPAHTRIYSMTGQEIRSTSEAKDQIGLVRGQLGGSGRTYWAVAVQVEGDKELALVNQSDVTDKGKVGQGGGGGGGHGDNYNRGFEDARDKAITAIQAL